MDNHYIKFKNIRQVIYKITYNMDSELLRFYILCYAFQTAEANLDALNIYLHIIV